MMLRCGLVVWAASLASATGTADPCCTPPRVSASCWLKSNGGDALGAIQAAVGCDGAEVVHVESKGGEPWVLDSTLHLNVSDQTILIDAGTVLQARRGAFHSGGSVLVSIDNVENVTLSGYGATLQMWKVDYANKTLYNHSEWRHAISITSARHILVEGVTAVSSGGDGINIGGSQAYIHQCEKTGELCDSENIWVRDANLTDNYRNAMSVTGVVNLTVERTLLAKTGGTCCMGGVDLEPEINVRHIANVTFRECIFEHNQMTQFVMNLGGQQNHTAMILLDSCIIRHGRDGSGLWILSVGKDSPGGVIELRNCTISDIADFGIRVEKKDAAGATLKLTDTVLDGVAYKGHWPLLIQSGGVVLDNLTVIDRSERAWVEAGWRTDHPVTAVSGTVTVENPSGVCHDTFNKTRGDQADVTVTCKMLPPSGADLA